MRQVNFARLWLGVVLLLAGTATAGAQDVADPDRREVVALTSAERHLVLGEMRSFVVALQAISNGLATEDMATVAAAARAMGSSASQAVPPSVVAKLPLPFREMAGRTHGLFDTIALDAEAMGDTGQLLGQMSELLLQCISCHNQYRIGVNDSP